MPDYKQHVEGVLAALREIFRDPSKFGPYPKSLKWRISILGWEVPVTYGQEDESQVPEVEDFYRRWGAALKDKSEHKASAKNA